MTPAASTIDTPAGLAPFGRRPTPYVMRATTPVEHLGEAIAELASRLHAATYELLVMIRRFDAEAGWNNGFASCAHWLNWRTGIDLGAAREKVRVARALADLPLLSESLRRGEVSYAKVRALTRVATLANEAQLLDIAWAGTADHVERVVRGWRRCDRVAAARQADQRHLCRTVTTWVDDDGMLVIRARLSPEQGAVVQRALEAAADRLFQEARHAAPPNQVVEEVSGGQRRADALALLAEAALASDLDRGNAGDRYQVMVHVDASAHPSQVLAAAPNAQVLPDEGQQAVVEVGDRPVDVSAETSRRLTCDASVVVMRHEDGAVLDVGRKTRTIPPAIRRALVARDTRCQFPGCTARRCDAHHRSTSVLLLTRCEETSRSPFRAHTDHWQFASPDAQVFRSNNRKNDKESDRFWLAVSRMIARSAHSDSRRAAEDRRVGRWHLTRNHRVEGVSNAPCPVHPECP